MEIKLTKWGNSYGVRLPKKIIDDLNISENESLSLEVKNEQIILKKNNYGEISLKDYAEKAYGKPFKKLKNILTNEELNWGENVGDEVW